MGERGDEVLDDDDSEIWFRRRFLAEFRNGFIDVKESLIGVFLEGRECVGRKHDGSIMLWWWDIGVRD